MKLIAKDFSSKTDLLDAVLGIRGKFIDMPTVVFTGMPEIVLGNHIQQVRFKLLPNDAELDIPQLPAVTLEKMFCWTHIEARISNDEDEQGMPWVSEAALEHVMGSWNRLEMLLTENDASFDDYFFKTNTEKKSSYTLTRDELMLLLSLQGVQTLRQVILEKSSDPVNLSEMIFNSMKHKLLIKSHYDSNFDYVASIRLMGDRLNQLVKNAVMFDPRLKQSITNQLAHDLSLLSTKYPDTECIGLGDIGIDVSETVSALMLTKDIQYTCNVGSAIARPLGILFASLCCSLAWSVGIVDANGILLKTDREIAEKYKTFKSERKTTVIRSQ